MRPPILYLTIAFGLGLGGALESLVVRGAWCVVAFVLVAALILARRAPLGAAIGIMGVAGLVWGTAAFRERAATCEGRWTAGEGWKAGPTRAAILRLEDPVLTSGGVVDADVLPGTCGGALRLRWPEGNPARGGTAWVVAGRWNGMSGRGVLVVRRATLIDPIPRGRGALRDALTRRSTELFGSRAPIVNALVFAPNAGVDAEIRERYVRSGLAHLLSISGLHVGFLAAWLTLILARLQLAPRARFVATVALLFA